MHKVRRMVGITIYYIFYIIYILHSVMHELRRMEGITIYHFYFYYCILYLCYMLTCSDARGKVDGGG